MGKVEIGNFYCLIGDNRILFLQNSLLNSMYGMDFSQFIGSTRKKKKENIIKIVINYTIQAFKASTFL